MSKFSPPNTKSSSILFKVQSNAKAIFIVFLVCLVVTQFHFSYHLIYGDHGGSGSSSNNISRFIIDQHYSPSKNIRGSEENANKLGSRHHIINSSDNSDKNKNKIGNDKPLQLLYGERNVKPLPYTPSYTDKNYNPEGFELLNSRAPLCTPINDKDNIDFTLALQFSYDRLWMMKHHCERWHHNKMSIIIYCAKCTVGGIQKQLKDEFGCINADDQIAVQVYDSTGVPEADYPVNKMRNMALSQVKTSHVLYLDVDFWPSDNLYEVLQKDWIREELLLDHKLALIIPAFQIFRQCEEYTDCRDKNIAKMPQNFTDVKQLWFGTPRQAFPFDPTNKGGHGSTMYDAWFDQPEGEIGDIECVHSNRYEPYVVVRYCDDLPPYQEHFTGYGKNKMTQSMQLRWLGYLLSQVGQVFAVHYPHLDSSARIVWNQGPTNHQEKRSTFKRGQVDRIFDAFKSWLLNEVINYERTSMCEDVQNDDQKLWLD